MAWLPEVMLNIADKVIADDWFWRDHPTAPSPIT